LKALKTHSENTIIMSGASYKEHLVAYFTFPDANHDVVTARLVTHNMQSSVDPLIELTANKPILLRATGDTLPIINIERWSRASSSSNVDNLGKDGHSQLIWSREYVTDQFADLRVADIRLGKDVNGKDIIVMTGTTAGHGSAFGGYNAGNGDIDGFITKLDANNGNLIEDGNGQVASARIQSLAGYTDEIRGMCIDHDKKAIYVVGSTNMFGISGDKGILLYTGFIKKLDMATLVTTWSRQVDEIDQKRDVFGRGCSVQEHESNHWGSVYFTGVVKDGGQVNRNRKSFGYDDIFVSYHEAENGNELFLTQFGTSYDDKIVTTEQSWFSNSNEPSGGVVVSSSSNNGQPRTGLFDGVDYVYQVTPTGMIEVLFGILPSDSQKLLEQQSMWGVPGQSRSNALSVSATGDPGDVGLTVETSGIALGLIIGLVIVSTVVVMLTAELLSTMCRGKRRRRKKRVEPLREGVEEAKEDEIMIKDENKLDIDEAEYVKTNFVRKGPRKGAKKKYAKVDSEEENFVADEDAFVSEENMKNSYISEENAVV